MSKVPIQNQGFRLDLNLQESNDDDAAWDNLYNPGISKDLAILVNNLRNTSILGPGNTSPVSISLTTNEINDANYGVNNVNTKAPHFFTFTKSNGELTDSTFTNDDTIQVNEEITFNIGDRGTTVITDVPTGQSLYTTPGTTTWTVPDEVTFVSVVCVGGGAGGQTGGGSVDYGGGGGGGALAYANNYSVTPGASISLNVGAGGGSDVDGTDSWFVNSSTLNAGGGSAPTDNNNFSDYGDGGTPSGSALTAGGDGGRGHNGDTTGIGPGGGGGAGGYGGNGGQGGNNGSQTDGADGGGGGGVGGGGGGGVGMLGQGSNGAKATTSPNGGSGGSGGTNGDNAVANTAGNGGVYGGGGGGGQNNGSPRHAGGSGSSGAVRIIWGVNRAFPDTNTADLTTTVHEGNGSGTVGSLATETLVPNKDYYVCSSNARNAFKISTTPSGDTVGVSTIPIISVNSNNGSFTSTFGFIRKDGVTAPNLTAFIKPETLDEDFNYLGTSGINNSFSYNVTAYEYSEFLIEKKYKTNKDILSDRDVKFEGSVRVKDPQGYNDGATALNATNPDGTPNSPGIFIGNTRAFSTDNNPWEKDVSLFSTKSHSDEFTIGDLEFGGEIDSSGVVTGGQIKIKGLSAEIEDITASDSKLVNKLSGSNPNVYKFPMIINGETYYILVEKT